jgi:hypothetical protein
MIDSWFGYFEILDQFFKSLPIVAFKLAAPVKPLEK